MRLAETTELWSVVSDTGLSLLLAGVGCKRTDFASPVRHELGFSNAVDWKTTYI